MSVLDKLIKFLHSPLLKIYVIILFGYKPEITIDACRGCNYAEYLIRNPQVETDYYMDKRKEVVRQWTVEKRSLIS